MDDKMSSPPTHLEHSEPTPGDVVAANVDVEYSPEARSGFSFHALFQKQSNEAFFREALDKYGHDGAIDPEAERRLVKKLDRTIIPLIGICYLWYYVDKTTLSYAAIFGIKDPAPVGLGLHGMQYSLASSAFYFGWAAWAIPANLLLQKSPPGSFLAANIFMWGVLLMAQAASKKFVDLLVLRILSGAFEAVADPCFMLLTSMFYTRAEQPARISMWYCFNGIGVAAGGLLGYGIGSIKGALVSWKYEFLIIGCLCSAWAFVLLIFMPSSPATNWWFSREERLIAVARLRGNQTGIENRRLKTDQLREAVLDVKTWLFFCIGFTGNVPNGGISNFSTLIISGMGFDKLQTALLGIPQGVIVVLWIGSGALLNSRLPNNSRTLVCMLFMLPTMAGALGFLLAPTDAYVGRLICFYLTNSYQASFVLSLSLITSNSGGQTKKMFVSAMIWLGACVGNIVSPFFYKAAEAPTYQMGIGSLLAANVLEFIVFVVLRFVLIRENKAKERARAAIAEHADEDDVKGAGPAANDTTFLDLTDKQNINFVYVY